MPSQSDLSRSVVNRFTPPHVVLSARVLGWEGLKRALNCGLEGTAFWKQVYWPFSDRGTSKQGIELKGVGCADNLE